jgi:hypothetical protein
MELGYKLTLFGPYHYSKYINLEDLWDENDSIIIEYIHSLENLYIYDKAFTMDSVKEYLVNDSQSSFLDKYSFDVSDVKDTYQIEFLTNPFTNKHNQISVYMRNLVTLIELILDNEDDFLDFQKKKKYISLIRNKLSPFEQIFLYFNSLSSFGVKLQKLELFTKYRFIKNIPLELLDFGYKPKEYFIDNAVKYKLQIKAKSTGDEFFDSINQDIHGINYFIVLNENNEPIFDIDN